MEDYFKQLCRIGKIDDVIHYLERLNVPESEQVLQDIAEMKQAWENHKTALHMKMLSAEQVNIIMFNTTSEILVQMSFSAELGKSVANEIKSILAEIRKTSASNLKNAREKRAAGAEDQGDTRSLEQIEADRLALVETKIDISDKKLLDIDYTGIRPVAFIIICGIRCMELIWFVYRAFMSSRILQGGENGTLSINLDQQSIAIQMVPFIIAILSPFIVYGLWNMKKWSVALWGAMMLLLGVIVLLEKEVFELLIEMFPVLLSIVMGLELVFIVTIAYYYRRLK